MRPIGGAEGMKWKKPNDFNSSEWSVRANSLDLLENGPLYSNQLSATVTESRGRFSGKRPLDYPERNGRT
jgi:hypothetical protein